MNDDSRFADESQAAAQAPAIPAPAVQEPMFSITASLREYARNPGYSHGDYADTMLQAALVIDRQDERLSFLEYRAAPAQPIADVSAPTDELIRDMYNWEGGRHFAARLEKIAARAAAPVSGPTDKPDAADEWRRLALQFDGHRMQALSHLKLMVHGTGHKESALAFLSAPPLSGEAVLAERIKALSATPVSAHPAQEQPASVSAGAMAFIDDVIEVAFEGGNLDGGAIQEWAETAGLIKPATMSEPCGDNCRCAENDAFPLTCYRKTYRNAPAPPSSESTAGDQS